MLICNKGCGNLDLSGLTTGDDIIDVQATAGDTHFEDEEFDNRKVDFGICDKCIHGSTMCTFLLPSG